MRINELCNKARLNGHKLFIPYLTCGDPTLAITEELIKQLVMIGADIIELGVPFSDPIADGKTNQLSSMRALKNQVSLTDCCLLVKRLRAQGYTIPIILFTYFNPIMRLQFHPFAQLAQECGIDAVLVVDLPIEESDEFALILDNYQIGRILLISPSTTQTRLKMSCNSTVEFLYFISRTGVTGIQNDLSMSLAEEITLVKQHTSLPIVIGFGISTAKQASLTATLADGVVVGSALVATLETNNIDEGIRQFLDLATLFREAI